MVRSATGASLLERIRSRRARTGVIGLGYVGLPLAVEFGKKRTTIGFDINEARVRELARHRDSTLEVDRQELKEAKRLTVTTDPKALKSCGIFIVTVPTPIDKYNRPDLTPVEIGRASCRERV